MRKYALAALGIAAAAVAAVLVGPNLAGEGTASSHREAPLIAEDPTGDNTDLYAFRSPDKPSTLTIVSNWIPREDPAAGPNWYTFSPSARYNIKIDRTGDGRPDLTYAFRFKTAYGPALPRQHHAVVHGHEERHGASPRERRRRTTSARGCSASSASRTTTRPSRSRSSRDGRREDLRRPA